MWKNIIIDENQIKYDSGKASLIKLPGSRIQFWLTNKCIHPHGRCFVIGINLDFTYLSIYPGKIKRQQSGESIYEQFNGRAKHISDDPDNHYFEHKPIKITPIEVNVDDSLLR